MVRSGVINGALNPRVNRPIRGTPFWQFGGTLGDVYGGTVWGQGMGSAYGAGVCNRVWVIAWGRPWAGIVWNRAHGAALAILGYVWGRPMAGTNRPGLHTAPLWVIVLENNLWQGVDSHRARCHLGITAIAPHTENSND